MLRRVLKPCSLEIPPQGRQKVASHTMSRELPLCDEEKKKDGSGPRARWQPPSAKARIWPGGHRVQRDTASQKSLAEAGVWRMNWTSETQTP